MTSLYAEDQAPNFQEPVSRGEQGTRTLRRTGSSTVWRRPWRKKSGAHSCRVPGPAEPGGRDKQRQWLEVQLQAAFLAPFSSQSHLCPPRCPQGPQDILAPYHLLPLPRFPASVEPCLPGRKLPPQSSGPSRLYALHCRQSLWYYGCTSTPSLSCPQAWSYLVLLNSSHYLVGLPFPCKHSLSAPSPTCCVLERLSSLSCLSS